MKFTEEQLRNFAKPLSETEEQQCKNAVNMVGEALKELGLEENRPIERKFKETPSYQLRMSGGQGYDVTIFLQGSYANNTNVRRNSDVDIAVVQENIFRTKYRPGASRDDYGFSVVNPSSISFKDEVEMVLKNKFGEEVKRGNKSIKIVGNSYRKDTDTVPSLRYRDYSRDYQNDANNFVGGILIKPDIGNEILNYPEQHLENGIEKNKYTDYYFKKMVRVGKEMRYRMKEEGYSSAKKASSFGLECLIWNVPNEHFLQHDNNYTLKFQEIVDYLYFSRDKISTFREVNGIKLLNEDDSQRSAIYKEFIEDLKEYYDYEK